MTRKANRRFLLMGVGAAFLTVLAAQLDQHTDFAFAHYLVGALMFAAFVLMFVLGIGPWVGSLVLKHPLQSTQGYRDDYVADPEKETGPYWSEGWRRKRERASLRNLKAFGLYIEPDEKS